MPVFLAEGRLFVSVLGDSDVDSAPSVPASTSWFTDRRRLLWLAGIAVTVVAGFILFLRQSDLAAVNSDGDSIILQAWAMLHGNLLLHGWRVADVTFYTTELPEYMLVTLLRGLKPDVVHLSAALTYTLLVLLGALLARGRARGREGVIRALIGGGIMLAPGITSGTFVMLIAPDHIGTAVPILLAFLLLDRLPERWYVPVIVCALLAWVGIADELEFVAAAVPLAVVCFGRAAVAAVQDRWRDARYELALSVAAGGSMLVTSAALRVLSVAGGFYKTQLHGKLLASSSTWPAHLKVNWQGLQVLFGADNFGHKATTLTAIAALHWVGLAAALVALAAGICLIWRIDRVSQVLVVAIVATFAAGVLSTLVAQMSAIHEVAVLMPFGAVLAGRLIGGYLAGRGVPRTSWQWPARAVLAGVGALTLAGYVAAQCYAATFSPAPPQSASIARWLQSHNFTYGLAGYWEANSSTVYSGGRVHILPLNTTGKQPSWESMQAWYDPKLHYANFIVTATGKTDKSFHLTPQREIAAFGKPAHTYSYGYYRILVWNKNLLPLLTKQVYHR